MKTSTGLSTTSVLRALGRKGWTFHQTREAMDGIGNPVADATIRIQLNAGRNGKGKRGEPAKLSREHLAYLSEFVDAE